jgi:hypothetical protein
MRNGETVSVPGLPREICDWLRRQAEEELTSRAAIVRRLVAEAWRQARDGERAA